MNDTNQKKLGSTLWNIADQLRGAMNADDFRDYMPKRISMERIAEEGYNLNISRYISTAQGEVEIDLEATHGELVEIEDATERVNANETATSKVL